MMFQMMFAHDICFAPRSRSFAVALLYGFILYGFTGVAQVVWIRNLGNTCCSQFDSNA